MIRSTRTSKSASASSSSTSSPLEGFVSIGPRTSLYSSLQHTPGQLVIICTWLGASRKHIAKYTNLYQQIAPGARILLIESNVQILVSSYARQQRHIQGALAVVLDNLAECGYYDPEGNGYQAVEQSLDEKERSQSPPKIILHTFSNGGTNTATQLLLELYRTLHDSSTTESRLIPFPLRGIILDSCPAKGTYWKSYNAMILSLPRDVVTQILGVFAVHLLLVMLYTWIACGNENPASLMRRTLLDETISRGMSDEEESGGVGTKRGRLCYLYSKEDKMCEWTDIRDHAEEARNRGWVVDEELFVGSAHCAHLSADSGKYINAMERMWKGEKRPGEQDRAVKKFMTKL